MAFISKKKHDDYSRAVQSLILIFENVTSTGSANEGLKLLRRDVEALNNLHEDYLSKLNEMHVLVQAYVDTQKQIRTILKHQKSLCIRCGNLLKAAK